MMTSTIDKYLIQIQEATKIAGIYAYRGQRDSVWPLHSAATRRLIEEHGNEVIGDPDFPQLYVNYHRETLIEPALTRGFGSETGLRLSDLELFAKLQHFGAATGLLDFTWSPLVALWFASEDPRCDGKLFVINTNNAIRVSRVPSDAAAQDISAQDISNVFGGDAGPPHLSYWEPMVSGDASNRILRQRSVFIIGRPLLPIDSDITSEIVVEASDKETLHRELETFDIHEESIFQDVYGFAQASVRRPVPPLTPEAYQRRGNRHYQRGEFAEATAAYNKSNELDPDKALTYLLRANVYSASGRHEEAIEDYDQAATRIGQLPRSIQDSVYFNRGNSKSELADYEGALQDYTEAININPGLSQSYYNRGNTYLDLYRFDQALLDYDKAISENVRNSDFNKGIALLALGRFSEARRTYPTFPISTLQGVP